MTRILSVSALLVGAGVASAAITGVEWRQVNNATNPINGSAPGSDVIAGALWNSASWQTWDLYITGAQGDLVNALDVGGDGGPFSIKVSGGVFNHPAGADTRSFATEGIFAAMPFDTFATFGGNATTNGTFGGFAGPVNLTGANGELRFTSFAPAGSPAALGANGLWVLRVSYNAAADGVLGGNGSRVQVGLPGGATLAFDVPAVPAPGSVALMSVAGLAGLRRRR
ncbi:MAG: hypothetical protein AB7G17_00670 [Phycisphaerales bacterium]